MSKKDQRAVSLWEIRSRSELRVGVREDALRPGQPDEVDRHLGRPVLLPGGGAFRSTISLGGKASDGWERKRTISFPGLTARPTPSFPGDSPLQEPHRLEEGEAVRLGVEEVLHSALRGRSAPRRAAPTGG